MSAVLLDGKAVAEKLKEAVTRESDALKRPPCLAVVLVGDDPASAIYVRNKAADCAQCGIRCIDYHLEAETTEESLLALVAQLNERHDVDGILVQLPLPRHIRQNTVLKAIAPHKDVDCFTPENVGLMVQGHPRFLPCTPGGIMALLREYGIAVEGKRCVVVGRSNIVGKPMAQLLLAAGGTVTVCHSRTADLAAECRGADILVLAAGQRGLVSGDMVKPGAVVIDVAMNRGEDGKLCGDAVFSQVAERAAFLTPVPGGVGPLTRAQLMCNTLQAAKRV